GNDIGLTGETYNIMPFDLPSLSSLLLYLVLFSSEMVKRYLLSKLGTFHSPVVFLGALNQNSVHPLDALENTVFHHERADGMYLLLLYALAQVIIESISVPSQAAAADSDFFNRLHVMDEEDSNINLRHSIRRHDGLANESSVSQVTVNRELVGSQPRGVDNIKQSLVDYVAYLLMPLYKARKIDKVMEQTTVAEKAMAVFEFLDFKRKNKVCF
ncbi:hypothetical protein Tco_1356560, partial [Tanacetum coccineum]